ncbi:hypothetical protein BN1012_Phect1510 [Candidatus Phaeomarinobacter ectocarpi]|uniref:Uncharacterized protein n=1 Tax=Candidatus Phaeomarinibacter ectocarpi TaxID=1458461 RepID=X5MFC9_9HYPH|nr:hypothetical protein BN1012_Phect1510 [Candidatus Phaeomarinobacter ectocarpi]
MTTVTAVAMGAATVFGLAFAIVAVIFAWPSFEQWVQKP